MSRSAVSFTLVKIRHYLKKKAERASYFFTKFETFPTLRRAAHIYDK
jgi:hypothetical protein